MYLKKNKIYKQGCASSYQQTPCLCEYREILKAVKSTKIYTSLDYLLLL